MEHAPLGIRVRVLVVIAANHVGCGRGLLLTDLLGQGAGQHFGPGGLKLAQHLRFLCQALGLGFLAQQGELDESIEGATQGRVIDA